MATQNNGDEDARTIYCANLSEKVTDTLLYELFLQVSFHIQPELYLLGL